MTAPPFDKAGLEVPLARGEWPAGPEGFVSLRGVQRRGNLPAGIEQENRRQYVMCLTVRDVPNAGDAKDGIIAGLQ